jgi:peptidoglycan/xylan/chitin deacetylase (PgdA/CDA1 family)
LIENNDDQTGKQFLIVDILFQTPPTQWLSLASLPRQPLSVWDISNISNIIPLAFSNIPIIYGNEYSNSCLVEFGKELHLNLDIFGSAFFMLTRYEELAKIDRDDHDRFPANASLAYQEGFLNRPIINEYIEILWYCLKQLWPELNRKKRLFRSIISHDVDVPFAQAFKGVNQLVRNCGGDILKRKSASIALERAKSWYMIRKGNYKYDLNYTFDKIMDISEQNGLRSAFYFKTACTDPVYDDTYAIDSLPIRKLLKDIYQRGHEIGLHPSYLTYNDPNQTRREHEYLKKVCKEENIEQTCWGGRQHFLRWSVPITWRNWAEAGLDYDSTLSYADHAGFRCGICYEYPVYDLMQRKQLSLNERPLIVMEGSVFLHHKGQKAIDYVCEMKKYCKMFNGDFTLLWHNSSFLERNMWSIYETIISM